MSASGVKLFDDDLAADVRDLFRELLQRGKTGIEATATLIEHFHEEIGASEEGVFSLALAAVQWEYGVLQPQILNRALRIVEDGSDLERWTDDPHLRGQRQRVLASLAKRLKSPQSNPKTVRHTKQPPPKCEWDKGDVLAYQLQSGQFILLRVVAVQRSWIQELPICELLDWTGTDVPHAEEISRLEIRRNKRYPSESIFYFPMTKRHLSRCRSLNLQLPPTMRDDGDYTLPLNFNALPKELDEFFGMNVAKDRTSPAS